MDHQRTPIRGLQALVGVAALAVGISHALGIEDVADLVRLVTIDARRQHICFFFPEFAADGLAMHLLDQSVALGAGGCDVLAGDRRIRVGVWQDAQLGATTSPFLSKPSPWMLSE